MCTTKRYADAMHAGPDVALQNDCRTSAPSPMPFFETPRSFLLFAPATPEHSPGSSSEDEWDEPVLFPADTHTKLSLGRFRGCFAKNDTQPTHPAKRLKLDRGMQLSLGDHEHHSPVSSEASTAPSTPPSTPMTSPVLAARGSLEIVIDKPLQDLRDDYNSLSEDELRSQLGVVGTSIAECWEKEDLVSVLKILEDIMMQMPSLEV